MVQSTGHPRHSTSKLLDVARIALLIIMGSIATLSAARAQDGAPPGSSDGFEQRMQRIVSGLRADTAGAAPMKLADRMNDLHVPGVSIAVVHGGVVDARGFGVATIGGPPVTPDTLFQAASISKPVTAVAALALVQAAKLDLDSDVNLFLKTWKLPANSFTDQSKVTLRRLLNHSAGITVPYFPGYPAGTPIPSLVDVLNGASLLCRDLTRFRPPSHDRFALCGSANTAPVVVDHEPGTRFKYSSGGYAIVQQLLVDVTGKPFPDLLEDVVLRPYGMTHSSFLQPLPKNETPMAATPYRATGEPVPGGPHVYPELAAAGLWTTPTDVAHFALGLVRAWTGRDAPVLSQATALQMLTPGLGNYGLGPIVLGVAPHRRILHAGVNDGFVSLMTMFENGDGAVIMTNGDQGGELANELIRSIATEYDWPDGQPKAH
ncbi:serine hydrolase domain-containing protein [Bradyrhizobium sp. USDA 4452]